MGTKAGNGSVPTGRDMGDAMQKLEAKSKTEAGGEELRQHEKGGAL